MAQAYVGFLRGVNVGGKGLLSMAELRTALSHAGLEAVSTYIQSGNILFQSDETDKNKLAATIQKVIASDFKLTVDIALFTSKEWQGVIQTAPTWWGKDTAWKHNILIMIEPFDMAETLTAIGEPKADIEKLQAGKGVLYQSISWEKFSRSTGGKVSSKSVYKKMTVRNFNTATKLLQKLEAMQT